ncbi:MAG: uracil-DNA glycosylase [Hadesarchaea archaeon]|nr:MAG: uracil-DNA glycosylase [Hadesarchaea archaeon]TDA33695.1 MAG: uracil-DNA glycosylase [Hadesarchaea archaeon]
MEGRLEDLKRLEAEVSECRKCGLWKTRTQTVFGSGPPLPRLVVVGEAPGSQEDREGLPFVGAAGKFLTSLLLSAGVKREEVYITNVIKCRPPNNRTPLPEETEACKPYLEEQLKILKPKLVVALGRVAASVLLGRPVEMAKEHGRKVKCRFADLDFSLFLTYHPAAGLYSGKNRSSLEEDFRKLGRLLRS